MDIMKNFGEGAKGMKDKIMQLAREHNLDPDRFDEWPEHIKKLVM